MSDYPNLQVTTAERVTTIRFDRIQKKHALTIEMYEGLRRALDAATADAGVRAVVLTGTADCFSSGNDVGDFVRVAQGGGNITAPLDFLRALAGFEKPLVAGVHGAAIGIGTTMLLHCDLVYAAPNARFKTPFVDLALVPEAASSLLLPALVGERRAAQLLLLCEELDAATALSWGLVNGVVDDAEATALATAKKLAGCAPQSLRQTKALTRRPHREAVLAQMQIEGEAFAERLRSPEALEALQAFMMRRPADFSKF